MPASTNRRAFGHQRSIGMALACQACWRCGSLACQRAKPSSIASSNGRPEAGSRRHNGPLSQINPARW
ncbi:hypothetical protein G6F64_015465 [Rhizopus arrhizus]|uniref:Uncharacterized protein n=1 Tax=Rhizopus oryzae TaxID=64495 RepID=A0A9P6WRD6_RHIOR|nr:hypothetical protein G6F23_015365 [Rhizopus arrhizus]KAG1226262.1 hypothetical protein G6F68_019774 [Rhizopus microsporus]KAG1272782.1 hypothetical protein G6F64_015465 [Rhizopus arrhizus]